MQWLELKRVRELRLRLLRASRRHQANWKRAAEARSEYWARRNDAIRLKQFRIKYDQQVRVRYLDNKNKHHAAVSKIRATEYQRNQLFQHSKFMARWASPTKYEVRTAYKMAKIT